MNDVDNKIDRWEFEWLQEQVWELKSQIADLQMENTLLRNDLNTIKNEGCWKYYERGNKCEV